jgi:hypothetical protein
MDAPSEQAEAGYGGAAVAGAALGTLISPLIALIVALLLQGGQHNPRKKAQLRTWAWACGSLLVLEVVIAVILVAVASSKVS